MTTAAVQIRNLRIRYGSTVAVDGLSLTAPRGAITAVVGPNGAGKTSTLEACAGLRTFDSGSITVLGERPGKGKERIGVMLQDGGLYGTAKPRELLEHLARLYPNPADPQLLLESLGVDPTTRTTIRRMSGGEQQRVRCAAALIGRPELAFLDEPTAGLDAAGRRLVHEFIRSLKSDGGSIVLTTHLMNDVEALADSVAIVSGGRCIREASVDELVGTDDVISFAGPLHANVEALRAALPDGAEVTVQDGRYRVSCASDPLVLSAIGSWCAQHGLQPEGLTMGRRRLDDVLGELLGGDQ